jgi:hypothetical protein
MFFVTIVTKLTKNVEQFEADIYAAQKIAISKHGITIACFSENQFNKKLFDIAKKHGIQVLDRILMFGFKSIILVN